jgi:hypothetical protein
MAKEKLKIQVINTNHSEKQALSFPVIKEGFRLRLAPTQFLMRLAQISGGTYQGLSLEAGEENLAGALNLVIKG